MILGLVGLTMVVLRAAILLSLHLSLAIVSSAAHADDTGSSSFFAEGQRLMAEGKYTEACPRFEKALALNPGAGTKFNLAECYAKIGKPAAALIMYRDVEGVTRAVGQQERSALAKQRADELEPRVPTVVVRAPWLSSLPQASITLDGRALTLKDIETPIRVDFGKHVAVASLDADRETRSEVVIEKEGETRTLALDSPDTRHHPGGSTSPAPARAARDGSTQRIAGLAVAGAGVLAMGIGTVMALSASSTYHDATAGCGTRCPDARADEANNAREAANLGGVVMGAGLALAAIGAVIWFIAPSSAGAAAAAMSSRNGSWAF